MRHVLVLAVACLPGALAIAAGATRPGLAVLALGVLIGLLMWVGRASPGRVTRLTIAVFVAKNFPMAGDSAMEWVDADDAEEDRNGATSDTLIDWIAPFGSASGNWRRVAIGAIIGAVASACVAVRDVQLANAQAGWLLPCSHGRDSIYLQAVLVVIAWTIWGAAFGGIITSKIYRRALLTSVSVAAFVATSVALAAAQNGNDHVKGMVIAATTVAAATAILAAAPMDIEMAQRQARRKELLSEIDRRYGEKWDDVGDPIDRDDPFND